MANETSSLLLAVDSRQVKEGAKSLDDLAKSGAGAEQATKGVTSASEFLAKAIQTVTGAYSSWKVGQFILEATTLNQRYSQMGLVMNVVAANTGKTRTEFDSTANTLQKLGISMLESRNTVIKLATANVDLANAEKLADLARNAAIVGNINTSEALDRLVLGVQSAQVEVLRGIGINVSFEKSYDKLAKQLGVNQNQLTETQKQQARLNIVLEQAVNFNGLYEASLANAGKMMKSTERLSENLKIKIGAIFDASAMLAVSAYSDQLLNLNNNADRLAANGAIKDWSRQIAVELAFVMDMGKNVFGVFSALGGLIANQGKNIANLDFGAMTATFAGADAELKAVLSDTSKYQDMVRARIVQEDLLTDKITGQNNNVRENSKLAGENTNVLNTNTDAVKKAAKVRDELTLAELRMQESTKNTIDLDRQVKSVISSVATEQDKFNTTLEELNRLKPYLPVETYNRALEKAQKELTGTAVKTRETTDQVSQLWIQAGRNIQSSLANSIFNFFDDGLKGMLKNVISTLGRIASEFAALKISQSIGLASIFGGGIGSTGAAASSSSGGSIFGSIANLGSNVMSGIRGGFGLSSLLSGGSSGVFSNLGGAGTAFIGGPGTALGGSGLGGLSSLGSSFGAAAGPVMAAFAVDAIGRALAGDKKLGGAEMIPVLGGFLAAMFGHGPMKFRQQSLQGDITSSGFDGDLTNVFRAKGGLFVGNKHKSVTEQLSQDQQDLFDQTIKGFYTSAHGFAENLGLSTELVDTFTKTIQIKSEKGKKLTEEAITEMIQGINDSLARNVMPTVDEFRIIGEKSSDTLSRLSSQFTVLTNAAELLFNMTSSGSKDLIRQFGFNDRNSFLEKAGGSEAFSNMVSGFANNFLTNDQRMKPVIASIVAERDRLGLQDVNTREQYVSAVQSGNMNPDQLLFLLSNQDAIKGIFDYLDSTATPEVEKLTAAETKLADARNYAMESFSSSLSSWQGIVTDLTSRINILNGATNKIFPMSMAQARSQLANGTTDSSNFEQALSVLTSGGGTFSSALDASRSAAANAAAIQVPADALQARLGIASNNVRILENYRNIASFDVGGRVPRDGMAMLHKDEQVFTRNDSMGMAEQIKELKRAVDILTIANNKINRRFGKWDDEGLPATRTA